MGLAKDAFFDLVRLGLPAGMELVNIESESEKSSKITVSTDGVVTTLPMTKIHTSAYFQVCQAELTVAPGTTLAEALDKLSKKYRLPLDLPESEQVIVFDECLDFEYKVTVSKDNIAVYGDFMVTFRNSETCVRCSSVVNTRLVESRIRLALASKVFKTYDVIVVGGGFGKVMLETIGNHIREIKIPDLLDLPELMVATVEEIVDDGISKIAIVRLPSTGLLFIRFKFIHSSKEQPDES